MLHKPSLSSRLLHFLLGTRLRSWRWLYVLAAVYPATTCIYFILSVYRDAYWQCAAVAFICLLQFFRPTVAGWVSVVVVYSSLLGGGLYDIFLELKDYLIYGRDDHTAFEGWDTILFQTGLTVAFAFILVSVVWHFPRARSLA